MKITGRSARPAHCSHIAMTSCDVREQYKRETFSGTNTFVLLFQDVSIDTKTKNSVLLDVTSCSLVNRNLLPPSSHTL
jgi:hypothetical protein